MLKTNISTSNYFHNYLSPIQQRGRPHFIIGKSCGKFQSQQINNIPILFFSNAAIAGAWIYFLFLFTLSVSGSISVPYTVLNTRTHACEKNIYINNKKRLPPLKAWSNAKSKRPTGWVVTNSEPEANTKLDNLSRNNIQNTRRSDVTQTMTEIWVKHIITIIRIFLLNLGPHYQEHH